MAQLGIPIRDAELLDIETYKAIVGLHREVYGHQGAASRQATQADIDAFLG